MPIRELYQKINECLTRIGRPTIDEARFLASIVIMACRGEVEIKDGWVRSVRKTGVVRE